MTLSHDCIKPRRIVSERRVVPSSPSRRRLREPLRPSSLRLRVHDFVLIQGQRPFAQTREFPRIRHRSSLVVPRADESLAKPRLSNRRFSSSI